jgi:hypothetical protein
VPAAEGRASGRRSLLVRSECTHQGFHSVSSRYDRGLGILAFILTCEHCGAELRELQREPYLPHYDPHGHAANTLSPSRSTS